MERMPLRRIYLDGENTDLRFKEEITAEAVIKVLG